MTNEAARMLLLTWFAEALQQAVAGERDGAWQCVPVAVEPFAPTPPLGRNTLAVSIRLRGTLHGEVSVVLSQEDACVLLAERDGTPPTDPRSAWSQTIEALLSCLPKRAVDAGTFAFSVESHRAIEPTADGVLVGRIDVRDAGDRSAVLHILGDDALVDSLKVTEWSTRTRSEAEPVREARIGRVIDVPLEVSLRFGERQMRLREVLELNTGSLVELDRQVEEPVDLLLGERVIARGEVVIVDGNYGLRVTEIVERATMPLS